MTALTDPSTFNLAQNTLIVAVVEVLNTIGYSVPSPENTIGAFVQVVPSAPPTSPERGSATDRTQLEVLYPPYSQDGGATIEAYGLEIDRGDGSGFVEAQTPSLDNIAVITSSITSGATYVVRYRARNVHGWSNAYSPELTIIAASVSSAPTNIETFNTDTDTPATTSVEVSWTAPSDLGGAAPVAITAYRILLRHSDGATFSESPSGSGCNPVSPTDIALVVAANSCSIEMSILRGAPFNLPQGALVVVKVQAQNVIGWSAESNINSLGAAAEVQTEPHTPS